MLFTYPGAISFYVYERLAYDKTFYRGIDAYAKTAICFFLSAFITILSYGILSIYKHVYDFSALIVLLKNGQLLGGYAFISLILSLVIGYILFVIRLFIFFLCNADKTSYGEPKEGIYKSNWDQIRKDYDTQSCIVIIKKDGKMVNAGVVELTSDDYSSDKSIVLSYSDYVLDEIKYNESKLIGNHVITYYDAENNVAFEYYAAIELINKIAEDVNKKQSQIENDQC